MFSRKINNKQNSIVQKKNEYNDIINKYLHKIDYQRQKLLVLRKDDIEYYKTFKKSYINENNSFTVIDTLLGENIQDSNITQGENKEVVNYDKRKKYYDWLDKSLRTYKVK